MKKSEGLKAMEEVAMHNGISVAEVRKEIELAISDAMTNPDPKVQEFWDKYLKSGRKPVAEEFIVYITKKIKSKIKYKIPDDYI